MCFKIIYLSVLPFEVQTVFVNISDADIPYFATRMASSPFKNGSVFLKCTTPWGSTAKIELLRPRNLSYHTLCIITDMLLGAQPFHFTASLS